MEKKKISFKEYQGITVFLILEILAITTFGLGAVNIVFHILGFLVALFSFLTSSATYKKGELIGLLPLVIPLFIFGLLVAISGSSYFVGLGFEQVMAFIGMLSFFLMGLSARRTESLKMEHVLLCVGGALALLVLINTIATWFDYGPFYPLIYRSTPDGYYRGEVIKLTEEMNVLHGFKFYESTINYGQQFAVLLSTSIPALFFIDRKKDTRIFLIVALFSVISVVSIVTITSLPSILFLAIVTVVGVLYRFFKSNELFHKLMVWALRVIGALILLFFVLVLINVSGDNFVSNLLKSNSFFDRAFNTNHVIAEINEVVRLSLKSFNLFGFKADAIEDVYGSTKASLSSSTKFIELEIIKEAGIFALGAFVVFVVFAYFSLKRYLKNSKDNHIIKSTVLAFLVVGILYLTFEYESYPLIHEKLYLNSFAQSNILLVLLFFIGYIANGRKITPVEFERNVTVKKEEGLYQSAVEEYNFSDSDQEVTK